MEIYVAIISALIALGSVCGLLSYMGNKPLFYSAWDNGKYFRTIFILLLHGPLVWIAMILHTSKYAFIVTHLLLCWVLQELPRIEK